MYQEITLRIVVMRPPSGVEWRVQSGREELLAPRSVSPDEIVFEVKVNVTTQGPVIFRGAPTLSLKVVSEALLAMAGPHALPFLCLTADGV